MLYLLGVRLCRRLGLGSAISIDREGGTVHSAQIAAAAVLRRDHVRRMIAFGIKCRGQRQDFGRTELHAKPARLTSLDDNGNPSFGHDTPTRESDGAPEVLRHYGFAFSQRGVMWVTKVCEAGHRVLFYVLG